MIYITQLIYLKKGEEVVFNEFESFAIPIIAKYNGKLELRIRPTKDTIIESSIEQPYEVHLVSFQTEEDFEHFKLDEERKKYLHLKQQSVRVAILIKGREL
jgi:hypothetical protein